MPHVGFYDFCKRAGVVCGAIIGVAAIVGWLWGAAIAHAMEPYTAALAEEGRARVAGLAEERAARIAAEEQAQHDRLDLMDIFMCPPGPLREAKLRETRARWSR